MEPTSDAFKAVRFAGAVLLVLFAILFTGLAVRFAFGLSMWVGFSVLAVIVAGLYWSAHLWIPSLWGLLVFGVFNSGVALITSRAANTGVPVSRLSALAFLLYFLAGALISRQYRRNDAISRLDRCAFLVYLGAVIWSVTNKEARTDPSTFYFSLLFPLLFGVGAIAIAIIAHRRSAGWRVAHASTDRDQS